MTIGRISTVATSDAVTDPVPTGQETHVEGVLVCVWTSDVVAQRVRGGLTVGRLQRDARDVDV